MSRFISHCREAQQVLPCDVFSEGINIIGGAPKVGKSTFLLNMALSVATGDLLLGRRSLIRGKVLYFALQDSIGRIESRIERILPPGTKRPDGLKVITEWTSISELDVLLAAHKGVRLVAVDSLTHVKITTKNEGLTPHDLDYYVVDGLRRLAHKYSVPVVVTHTLVKGHAKNSIESFTGSYGITGAADGLQIIEHKKNANRFVLHLFGRDVPSWRLDLNFDKCNLRWSLDGWNAETTADNVCRVLLEDAVSMRVEAIAAILNQPTATISRHLKQLVGRDEVIRFPDGKYASRLAQKLSEVLS